MPWTLSRGVVLGLLTINEVHALGLGELVDLSTGETSEELLGELVGDGFACRLSASRSYVPIVGSDS